MQVFCPSCQQIQALTPEEWRCQCGQAWEPVPQSDFFTDRIDGQRKDLWRYRNLFGLDFVEPKIVLGAGWTSLLPIDYQKHRVLLKLEYLSPSGSFKDRGTEVEINALYQQGVNIVVDDSSGNAGASLAAYAARGGMEARIFVPNYTSQAKIQQISAYGAKVHSIEGNREDAKIEALRSLKPGVVYASHEYHPGFLLGQESVAWELWEQMNGQVPDWYVVPVGQGVHLLGAWLGFSRLKAAGLIKQLPRLVAVQPALLDPIIRTMKTRGDDLVELNPTRPSIAEGLAVAKPSRWKRVIQAIRESKGMGISVEEDDIHKAQIELAHLGFFVEPTSATVFAALPQLLAHIKPGDKVVIPLTGNGLKGDLNLSGA